MRKTPYFSLIGVLLFLIWVLDTLTLLQDNHFSQMFWFCNAMLIILAIGFHLRSATIFTGVLLGGLIVQTPWLADFFSQLLFNTTLSGVTTYVFEYGLSSRFLIEMNHLLIIPLSLFGIIKVGFSERGWLFASLVSFIVNYSAYLTSSYQDNVNCVFYNCLAPSLTFSGHLLLYTTSFTFFLCISYYLLQKIIMGISKV